MNLHLNASFKQECLDHSKCCRNWHKDFIDLYFHYGPLIPPPFPLRHDICAHCQKPSLRYASSHLIGCPGISAGHIMKTAKA